MAHPAQQEFVISVRDRFPAMFHTGRVLDVGSQDINGSNRTAFGWHVEYLGIDLGPGMGVDVVAHAVHFAERMWDGRPFDVVISTEALEHDKKWKETLAAMWKVLRPGGLLVLTCAGTGRPEHGTKRTSPQDSPHTTDYYLNLSLADIKGALAEIGAQYAQEEGREVPRPVFDTHFWAFKA